MPTSSAKKSSRPTWSRVENNQMRSTAASTGSGTSAASQAKRGTATRSKSGGKTRARTAPGRAPKTPVLQIPPAVRREMVALTMLVVAALFTVGLLTWSGGGGGVAGIMGGALAQLFGVAAWLVPGLLAAGAVALLFGQRSAARLLSPTLPLGLTLLLLGAMGFFHLFANGQLAADKGQGGGYVGLAISSFLSDYFTGAGAGIILLALILVGFMLAFGLSLARLARGIVLPIIVAARLIAHAFNRSRSMWELLVGATSGPPKSKVNPAPVRLNGHPILEDTAALSPLDLQPGGAAGGVSAPAAAVKLLGEQALAPASASAKPKPEAVINVLRPDKKPLDHQPAQPLVQSSLGYLWSLPPVTLLETSGEMKISQTDIKARIKVIEETLQSFNVEATVREVNTGPAVTQFAIEPGVGVRVNRITSLDKDLALALAAPDIRIEAPIPGQSRIGIEVPNVSLQVVGLRDIMEADSFQGHKGRLKIALGRDTHGQPVLTDLTKLPHILVAGATGSGKSVFLNSMIIGFLLQFTPDDLRMLMIDPKRVELTSFNGIPHLLRPVVTDVRMEKDPQMKPRNKEGTQNERERPLTAVEALKWALWEMERRYKLFAKGQRGSDGASKVFRNIEQYRTFHKDNPQADMEHLPYIVIIIDELADLMLTAPEEVETSLCRLAQLARATGIHLVVATQRPSVDVVTGLIKANFPARAAFAVTSQVDSKVILDTTGAEKLLGRGDMLYTASDESKPVRIQGTFVSDSESDKVINFWRKQLSAAENNVEDGDQTPVAPMQMPDWLGTGDANEETELLEQAIELVKKSSYVSVSMLQRKLRVGYNRAARLVEQMEEMGLISPANSDNRGKPREVLLGAPDYRAMVSESHIDTEEA